MSTTPSQPTPSESSHPSDDVLVVLTSAAGLGKMKVELESFVGFNVWMTRELAMLEERFADFQTPRSMFRRKNRRS